MQKEISKFILVIDDSEDNQTLLKMYLSAKGFHVECTSNGHEALSLLTDLSNLPDLILLDAQMPVMDGYRFRIEQSQISRLKDIPVIIMSGNDDLKMAEKMLYPQGVIVKPVRIQSLLENITFCLH